MSRKYYWLKLKKDFFKRHDIQIIESMPNGKDYVLFYLKLLCESIDHEGNLRFSEEIPYNEEMLATITRTNVDIVRSAIQLFTRLGMMELIDDGTLYMRGVEKMIGEETEWAKKKREYREKVANSTQTPLIDNGIDKTVVGHNEDNVREDRTMSDKSKSKSKSKSFIPPTVEEVEAYCFERQNGIDAQKFVDYYTARGWELGKGRKMKDWKACVRTWERNNKEKPKGFTSFMDL